MHSVQALTSQQRYLPFGQVRTNVTSPNSQSLITDLGYTGQRALDPGMGGLMDYHARFYSPMLGRFTQPDTITPGGPQGLNRYAYANNNPLYYTDPSGHLAIGDSNNEAGCSGKGPKCIIDMYYRAGDDQGMDDSLRAFLRRHKDYNPHTDVELIPEEITIVVGAMFQNAIQDKSAGELGSTGADLIILGIIVGGSIPMMGPDGGGGGGGSLTDSISQTLKRIDEGGPFPFGHDGQIFQNRERLLPPKSQGYYQEYTVITPGSSNRGTVRIVTGQNGEAYLTFDHYKTFTRIR